VPLPPPPPRAAQAINACERGGQWEEAEMLLQEMQALGLSPDRVTYNTAIAAAARAAQVRRVSE
jgi:pentatricopeptide repeat domain-containing protein 1